MDFDATIIKMTLRSFGIKDLAVKCQAEQQQLVARFKYQGQAMERTISFTEIENLFAGDKKAG
jgi:hypothetical protein